MSHYCGIDLHSNNPDGSALWLGMKGTASPLVLYRSGFSCFLAERIIYNSSFKNPGNQ